MEFKQNIHSKYFPIPIHLKIHEIEMNRHFIISLILLYLYSILNQYLIDSYLYLLLNKNFIEFDFFLNSYFLNKFEIDF